MSLNGIVSVTSADTGKVLDIHPMSKYCKCQNKNRNEQTDNCSTNYIGTSGGMEVEGAKIMFARSVPQYNVRYVDYLGDGDSNAYKAVCEAMPYGADVVIQKQECVGHVQKRMGARLRDLKNRKRGQKLSDGKPLTGKGRLTDMAMKKLQIFYGLAIRRNTNSLEAMQAAVWAVYFHVKSSNKKPTHQLCSKGDNTWCKFLAASRNKELYEHEKHFHLPEAIMNEVKPIFQSLADINLLRRCLKGKTQNPNESLNNVIWSRLPKRTFVTLPTLKFGVYEAVLAFNDGNIANCRLFEHLGLKVGSNCVAVFMVIKL